MSCVKIILANEPTAHTATFADMAELADALDSGSSECKFMQVQVLLSAPTMEGCPSGLRS